MTTLRLMRKEVWIEINAITVEIAKLSLSDGDILVIKAANSVCQDHLVDLRNSLLNHFDRNGIKGIGIAYINDDVDFQIINTADNKEKQIDDCWDDIKRGFDGIRSQLA